jgi:hypothetical protein
MSDIVNIEELRDMRDQILGEVRRGFAGVHARQDQTNGRVLKTEKDVLIMGQSVDVLTGNIKTIFRMLNRRHTQRTADDISALTKRYSNKAILTGVIAGTVAISEAVQKIVPALIEAFKSWPR